MSTSGTITAAPISWNGRARLGRDYTDIALTLRARMSVLPMGTYANAKKSYDS